MSAAALTLIVVALLWLWLAGPDMDVTTLRAQVAGLSDLRQRHPWASAAAFALAYVAVAALSLPVAVWLTLAAGALFGFWTGLAIASFASAIGATLACLAARHLLRDRVRARLGARAQAIEAGLARDGAFHLFTLRLIPVVPFFAVNLLMGLTRIRIRTFYVVSQAGMLPATALYVNAGTQLAGLDSLSGIVSAPILASLAALAGFPWLARGVIAAWRRRAAAARWTRPKKFDRNLVVIGAGAAGLVSAYVAAAAQARVTLVQAGPMGGDCLNYGCVPSKALIRSATLAHQMRHAAHWGLTPDDPQIPFRAVMARIGRVIADIAPHDSEARYTALGVEVRRGHARLIDPWTVAITAPDGTEDRLTTRAIIIATGARPVIPPVPGLDLVDALTTDTLWSRLADRDHAPRRLVVLGGGPVGCELAQAFARLGSTVTLIEAAPRLLPQEDADVSDLITASLREDGVRVLTGQPATACGIDGEKWIAVQGSGRIPFDTLIVAVGRQARLTGCGLRELGIPTGRVVETNAYLQTRFPHILAAGDVAGPVQLTHAASHQGWFAAVNALLTGIWRLRADQPGMPRAVFTDPELARVGLSEDEAHRRGIPVTVTRFDLADLDRAITDGAARGFVKVLTVPGRDRILGATIVGDHAGDLIAEFVLAMKHGLGLNKLLATIHIYPTWAEANKAVAGIWRRAHVNPRLPAAARRFHRWRRG